MNESECLSKMVAPGQRRPGIWRGGVLQVLVASACPRHCTHCTQASNTRIAPGFMPPELYNQAVRSLLDYFGVVGMHGGEPSLHPEFETLCHILAQHIPFEQRGIWTARAYGKAKIMREVFNPVVSNINVHQDRAAYDEFKADWPECRPIGLESDSRHSPPFVSMVDLEIPEADRWERISRCPINRSWSAIIALTRWGLRAFFCEMAAAQTLLGQHLPDYPDTGLPVEPGWWRKPMDDFAEQVRWHCHRCGIPLNGHGGLANDPSAAEQVTISYADLVIPKRSARLVELVTSVEQLGRPVDKATEYLEGLP